MTSPLPDLPQLQHKIADEAQSRDQTPELGSGEVYYDVNDAEEADARPEPVPYNAAPELVQHNEPPESVQQDVQHDALAQHEQYQAPSQQLQEVHLKEHVHSNGKPEKKK